MLSSGESLVVLQFVDILRSVELPLTWREAIAEQCQAVNKAGDDDTERIRRRRAELDEEHKRLITLFKKGYVEDYWPPKLDREAPRLPSHPPSLTPAQQEQAIMLIR